MTKNKKRNWTILREYKAKSTKEDCIRSIIRLHLSSSALNVYPDKKNITKEESFRDY